jgi:hypothetical protein
MSTHTLEQRIATALADDDVKSDDLDLLTQEVEMAASAADKAVQKERERALDPSSVVDGVKAREAVVAAEFLAQRLRKALPHLQARFQQVHLHERYSTWLAEFERVKPRHDAAVARLKAVYLEFEGKLVDALNEAQEVDAEVKNLSSVKPYDAPEANGDGRNLLTVEMVARGITGIGLHDHSIMKDLKLPDFGEPTKLAWPPPTSLAVQVAASMIQRPHPGANWASEREERAQTMREEQERVIAHYDAMARQREEREAAEAQKRGKGAAA